MTLWVGHRSLEKDLWDFWFLSNISQDNSFYRSTKARWRWNECKSALTHQVGGRRRALMPFFCDKDRSLSIGQLDVRFLWRLLHQAAQTLGTPIDGAMMMIHMGV